MDQEGAASQAGAEREIRVSQRDQHEDSASIEPSGRGAFEYGAALATPEPGCDGEPVAGRSSRGMAEEEAKEGGEDSLGMRMLKTRTVLVSGAVNDKLAEKVIAQLLILDADSHAPIRVMITSQGGHVDSGFAIHDMLRFIESPVVAIGAGWVASIAVPILFGAPKERRYSLPNTRFLLHQPSGGAGGQASDIRIEAEEILKVRERLNQLIAFETGQTVEKVARDSDRNFWMDAEQAVTYGLVGRVITSATELV